jgi:protoheme IX farnesyltransferase
MIVLTAAAGYYLAIDMHFEEFFSSGILILHFLLAMTGTMLTSAGSCVLNNVMEVEYDKSMKRTAKRALPSGLVTQKSALLYGLVLSFVGAAILFVWINAMTAILSVITIVSYVLLYTPLKRKTMQEHYPVHCPHLVVGLHIQTQLIFLDYCFLQFYCFGRSHTF